MQHQEVDPPDVPKFPSLEPEITTIESNSQLVGALHSLVLDHLVFDSGECHWVDAHGHATTSSLARLAPSRRVLDRISVARAFTAFQHHSLIETLEDRVRGNPGNVSLIVVPCVEWFYANGDLPSGEADAMLSHAIDRLDAMAATTNTPVLVTRATTGELGAKVTDRSDRVLECQITEFGPRFVGEEFETLVYEVQNAVQTTLAFWRRVLRRRFAASQQIESTEVVSRGTN